MEEITKQRKLFLKKYGKYLIEKEQAWTPCRYVSGEEIKQMQLMVYNDKCLQSWKEANGTKKGAAEEIKIVVVKTCGYYATEEGTIDKPGNYRVEKDYYKDTFSNCVAFQRHYEGGFPDSANNPILKAFQAYWSDKIRKAKQRREEKEIGKQVLLREPLDERTITYFQAAAIVGSV